MRWTDPTGEGLWTFIKCARIIQKWQKNCFSKLPDCRTACGKTAEDQLAALAACMQDHADKSSRCLEGMNRELVEAKCATMSVGKPPGG
jgi:hypothetical protein